MDNYEQKYNEILEWARKNKARLNGVPIEEVLPELKESEDERIRKELIETINCMKEDHQVFLSEQQIERYLAYLEKQKEQKPVQTEDEKEYVRILKSLVSDFIRDHYKNVDITFYQKIYDWLDGRQIRAEGADDEGGGRSQNLRL